jgi:hypothetical protein
MKRKSIILFVLFICISVIYFFLSQISFINEIRSKPPYTVFPLYHTNSDFDFNAYLSVITQSKNGAWLMTDPYTTEPTNPTLFYFFFILVGKFALLFNLAPNIAYQIIRLISVVFYILTLYLLTKSILGPIKGAWAAIIATIGTIAPLSLYHEPEAYVNYTDWWGNMEATNRMDQMPHYLVSTIFLYIIIMLVFSFLKKPHPLKLITSFLLAVFGGLFFPPMLLPLLFGLPCAYLLLYGIDCIKKRNLLKLHTREVIAFFVVLAGIVIPYLLMLRENQNGFPWDVWANWERARWSAVTAFDKKLFISFGILPYLCLPISLIILIKSFSHKLNFKFQFSNANNLNSKTYIQQPITNNSSSTFQLSTFNFQFLFIILWAYLPYILLPITNINITFISKYRLTTMSPFVPFGILASMTAFWVYNHAKWKILKWSVFILILATTIPVTVFFIPKQVQYMKITKINTSFYHYYVPISDWVAIGYIRDNVPKKSIVLANRFLGNLIPAYAEVITYVGHHVHTKNFDAKDWETNKFYSNQMSTNEAYGFIKSNNIQYIMYGPGERLQSTNLNYPFLKIYYKNNGTLIYTL